MSFLTPLVGVVFGGVVFGGGEGSGDIFGGAALPVFLFPFASCLSVVWFAGDLDRTTDRLDLGTEEAGGAAADDEAAAEAAAEANGIVPGSLPKFFTTKSLTLARFLASLSSASLVLFRNSSAVVSISSAIFLS